VASSDSLAGDTRKQIAQRQEDRREGRSCSAGYDSGGNEERNVEGGQFGDNDASGAR
jgi:hypothetical protein